MTDEPRTVVEAASCPSRQDRPAQPNLRSRVSALLKDLFANPDAKLPINNRGEMRKPHGGVFQPPRY